MAFTFDAARIQSALRERGFDTAVGEGVVSGRLDEGAVRQVWIDAGGTLRLQLTRGLDEGQTERLTRGEQAYRVSRERQAIVNVWTDLASLDRLGDSLDEADALARRAARPAEAAPTLAPAPVQPPASAPLPGEPGAGDAPADGAPTPKATPVSQAAVLPPPVAEAHPEASADDAPPTADESRPDDTPADAPPSLGQVVAAQIKQLVPPRTRRRKPR